MARYYSVASYSSHNSLGYLVRRSLHLITPRVEAVLAEGGVPPVPWIRLNFPRARPPTPAARRPVGLKRPPAGPGTLPALKPGIVDCPNAMLEGFPREEAGALVGLLPRFTQRLGAELAAEAPRRRRRASGPASLSRRRW